MFSLIVFHCWCYSFSSMLRDCLSPQLLLAPFACFCHVQTTASLYIKASCWTSHPSPSRVSGCLNMIHMLGAKVHKGSMFYQMDSVVWMMFVFLHCAISTHLHKKDVLFDENLFQLARSQQRLQNYMRLRHLDLRDNAIEWRSKEATDGLNSLEWRRIWLMLVFLCIDRCNHVWKIDQILFHDVAMLHWILQMVTQNINRIVYFLISIPSSRLAIWPLKGSLRHLGQLLFLGGFPLEETKGREPSLWKSLVSESLWKPLWKTHICKKDIEFKNLLCFCGRLQLVCEAVGKNIVSKHWTVSTVTTFVEAIFPYVTVLLRFARCILIGRVRVCCCAYVCFVSLEGATLPIWGRTGDDVDLRLSGEAFSTYSISISQMSFVL